MKQLLFFALLFAPAFIQAQDKPLPVVDGVVTYSDVVMVDLPKDELYPGCRNWFSTSFRTAEQSWLKIDNRTAGEMTGIATIVVKHPDMIGDKFYYLDFTVSIFAKDHRFKWVISDIELRDKFTVDGQARGEYRSLDPKINLLKQQELANGGKKTAIKIINMVNTELYRIGNSIKGKVAAADF